MCYNSGMSIKSSIQKIPGYNSLVKPLHLAQAVVASVKNGRPAKNLRVIGVTGTNGKTTTCFLIWKMLNESGRKTGLLTTVGWSKGGNDLTKQIEHMTTERVRILNQRIKAIRDAGAEFLVLEVTSHAMSQYRTWGIPIEVAVFTNLTHEHLDYHKTMKNYRAAKGKLFKKARSGVINADDESAEFFAKQLKHIHRNYSSGDMTDLGNYARDELILYGMEHGDTRATEVEMTPTGIKYACSEYQGQGFMHETNRELRPEDWSTMSITVQIPGKFNVYNSLAAVGVGRQLGLTDAEIRTGIAALTEVEGRMTKVDVGQDFTVIVDYAHVPDALEKVLTDVKASLDKDERRSEDNGGKSKEGRNHEGKDGSPVKRPRIITVHGGAGQRDHSTRMPRGEILGKYSDVVIITEDDSRDEDPAEIAAEFVKGAEQAGKKMNENLFVELDRRKAIDKAISEAKSGDVVLILGKGHEKTILRADGPHDFEDIKVAREILQEKRGEQK